MLSGVCFAIGYGLGVLLLATWEYLQLPLAGLRLRRAATWVAAALAAAVVVSFVWKSAGWQDSIRERMGMPLLEAGEPLTVALVAAVVFVVLLFVARAFRSVGRLVRRWLARYVPERVSALIGGLVALLLFWALVDGVLLRGFMRIVGRFVQRARRADRAAVPAAGGPDAGGKRAVAGQLGGARARGAGVRGRRGRRRRRSRPSPGGRRCGRSGSMPG